MYEEECSSSEEMDQQQETLLAQKYGQMKLKQRFIPKKINQRKYFDSADWALAKQGKVASDSFLDYDVPIENLPVKHEPTKPSSRTRSNMDAVEWPDQTNLNSASRSVIDI